MRQQKAFFAVETARALGARYAPHMRAWLVLSLGLAVGCGGSEAGDVTDGGPDAASADTSGARDSTTVDAPPSDTSTLDSAPPDAPPGCTLFSDPCVAQFVAQTERAAACIGHPDTCASSGGTDASGCGLLTKDPDGTQICTWTDGAVVDNGKTTGKATNGKGDLCYSYNLVESGGSVTITISFPGVAGTWTERVTPSRL